MSQITLSQLAHSYAAHPKSEADYALKEMDHVWQDGGAYALLGSSGCGKTTLLNIISGLVRPSQGRVLFGDTDVTDADTAARNIAQVFQFPVVYDTMSVRDNLSFPLRNRGMDPAYIGARVNQIARMIGMEDILNRKARGLTADAKQKISLGRGMVREDVNAILFDEPLTVIDPHMKWELRTQLKQLHREFGHTMIYVTDNLIGEGDVVEKLQTQMQTGENIYDAYINDSDLIGTHWRYQLARNLTDWMAAEGASVTNPNLDLADFIGTKFTTGPDGKPYQLPDQQFANLYWFRYDWFNDQKTKDDFKAKYGYDLGVPVNWSAYADIAEFFTGRDMSYAGGPATGVYGNMDYGKKDPSLGWRYTDAWMSMAGMGDVGEPNGLPVDEWGIRVNENSQPVGSCVARSGSTNDAAAVYAVTKAIEWLQKYSPPEAAGMTFGEAGPVPAQGAIAQQMFWYTACTAASVVEGTP